MKNKNNKNYSYESDVIIYMEPITVDEYSLVISDEEEQTITCPDIQSISERNIKKFSKAWKKLAKK